jgi:hypothetical protein
LNILVQHPGRQFKAIKGRRTLFTTMAVVVMAKTVTAAEDVTDGRGGGRWHIEGNTSL